MSLPYLGTQTDQPTRSLSAAQYTGSCSSDTETSLVSLTTPQVPTTDCPQLPACTFKDDSCSLENSKTDGSPLHTLPYNQQQPSRNESYLTKTSSSPLHTPILYQPPSTFKKESSYSLGSSPLHTPKYRPKQPPPISKYDGCFLRQGSPTLLTLRAGNLQSTSKDSSGSGQSLQPCDNLHQRDHDGKRGFKEKCLQLWSRTHTVPTCLKQVAEHDEHNAGPQAHRDKDSKVTNSAKDGSSPKGKSKK